MLLTEKEILIPKTEDHKNLLVHISNSVNSQLGPEEIPVRVAVTKTDTEGYHCEIGTLSGVNNDLIGEMGSIFDFEKRKYENAKEFNTMLLVPTGIGAELGGHSGDGGSLARLIAANCDNLITHPNVVNAADINEIPDNALYVEGSVISRMIMGKLGLQKVNFNLAEVIFWDFELPGFERQQFSSIFSSRHEKHSR